MACTNCGVEDPSGEYELSFTRSEKGTRVLDLSLCDDCLDDFLAETEIQLAEADDRTSIPQRS